MHITTGTHGNPALTYAKNYKYKHNEFTVNNETVKFTVFLSILSDTTVETR